MHDIWKPLFVADYGIGQISNVASPLIINHGYKPSYVCFKYGDCDIP
jgi:hypothetical protein